MTNKEVKTETWCILQTPFPNTIKKNITQILLGLKLRMANKIICNKMFLKGVLMHKAISFKTIIVDMSIKIFKWGSKMLQGPREEIIL